MKAALRDAFETEMDSARRLFTHGETRQSFHHLERAHILGQRYFRPHLITHWWMFRVGIREKNPAEIRGQIARMVAVLPGYISGWIPVGNSGGSDVFALKKLPIPDEFAELLAGPTIRGDMMRRVWIALATLLFLSFVAIITTDV